MQLRHIAGKDSGSRMLVDTELEGDNKEGHDGDGMAGKRANKPSARQGGKTGMAANPHNEGLPLMRASKPSVEQNDKEGLQDSRE